MEKFGVELPQRQLTKTAAAGTANCPKCGLSLEPGVPPRCPKHGTEALEESCKKSEKKGSK